MSVFRVSPSIFLDQIFFPFTSDKNFSLFPFLVRFLHIRKDSTRKGKRENFLCEMKGKKISSKKMDPKREKSLLKREKSSKNYLKKGLFRGLRPRFFPFSR